MMSPERLEEMKAIVTFQDLKDRHVKPSFAEARLTGALRDAIAEIEELQKKINYYENH